LGSLVPVGKPITLEVKFEITCFLTVILNTHSSVDSETYSLYFTCPAIPTSNFKLCAAILPSL
jgi:hypothetical protein